MNRNDPTHIEFKGKRTSVRFYCEGLMICGRGYYLMDHASNEWKVCSADRLAKLVHKYGSAEELGRTYTSRKSGNSPSGAKGDKVVKKDVCNDTSTASDRFSWVHPDYRDTNYKGVVLKNDQYISEESKA